MLCMYVLQKGQSVNRCELALTLCKYVENVWWRCAQYFVLPNVAMCLQRIYMDIWRMFDFMYNNNNCLKSNIQCT